MQIVDVAKERSEEEGRNKGRYDKVISLADEVFGRERISGEGRGIASSRRYDSIYVDFVNKSGPLRCGVEISLVGRPEILVHDENNYQNARKFGEEFEKRFGEDITLKHNYCTNYKSF